MAESFIILFFSAVIFILLRYYLNKYFLFNNSSDQSLSHEFESREPQIGDHLLNALQLEESMGNLDDGKDLAEHAVSKLNDELDKIPRKSFFDPISHLLKKTLVMTVIIGIIFLLVFINTLPQAFIRLAQPAKDFPVPLPFVLNSMSGNQDVLGGDTLTIGIAGLGDLPDSIHIYWENSKKSDQYQKIAKKKILNRASMIKDKKERNSFLSSRRIFRNISD